MIQRTKRLIKNITLYILRRFHTAYSQVALREYNCYGDVSKLKIGKCVSTVNTLFNVASGNIIIGDHTIFGHNCMVLTGQHEFIRGKRKKLVTGGPETPASGFDIEIGCGCWIASGCIILGNVKIGDNSIIGAGAVVTKDIPSGVLAVGVPARIIKKLT